MNLLVSSTLVHTRTLGLNVIFLHEGGLTLLNLGMNEPKICPEDFMGAVRFLRVCRSPLKQLEV